MQILMKYSCLIIFATLVVFSQCNKDEHTKVDEHEHEHEDSTQIDYRDALVGTYIVSSFTEKAHFNTPPVYDSIFYNNDTVSLSVTKSPDDTLRIVIASDTLVLGAGDSETVRFIRGCCGTMRIALFKGDSITYTIQDAGNATSLYAHGWKGRKL